MERIIRIAYFILGVFYIFIIISGRFTEIWPLIMAAILLLGAAHRIIQEKKGVFNIVSFILSLIIFIVVIYLMVTGRKSLI